MDGEPQRFCLGIAYMPGKDDRIAKGLDGGRDFITEAELEKAAWSFLRSGPQVNAFHVTGTEGVATVVESSIHRGPDWDLGDGIVVTKGTWLVGAILEPKAWQLALDGRANGWSPEGIARRRKVLKEGAVPIAKGAMPDDGDEEFSELIDCDFPTIGLVGKGANGIPRFLVMKNADGDATGLLEPEFVRDLITKAEPAEPEAEDMVTMTGSPAAIAKLIHGAPVRPADDVAKGKYDAAGRKRMAGNGEAMKDESYPIADKADLGKAIRAVGRGGSDHDAIRRHVIARAKALGASSEIPDNWAADGSLKEASVSKTATVAKDAAMGPELDEGVDGMDPTVALAEPDEMGPGDMTDPGSPAWESIDAATAQKWTSIAVRLKNALGVMSEREFLEAASADPDDAENGFDLEDAMCAVDFVISTLAVYAAGEQAEADLGGEAMDAIGKSAAPDLAAVAKAMDAEGLPGALSVIETFSAVRKSGRVLSSVNEAHIREAHARLNTVLSSLPSAPVTDDGQPVAKSKEAAVTATATETAEPVVKADEDVQSAASGPVNAGGTTGMGQPRQTGPAESAPADGPQAALPGDPPGRQVIKAALALVYDQGRRLVGVTDAAAISTQVAKADGEKAPMQAVFDQNGDLIGIVAPDAIQPVTGAGKPPAEDAAPDAAPDADPADMTPAPPAETGTPASAVDDDSTVAKSTQETITLPHDVLKSILVEAVTAALGAQAPAQDIAKSADVAGIRAQVESLLADVEVLKEQPAAPKVFANGQVPPANQLRGQDQGASPVNVAKAAELKNTLYRGTAPEQNAAFGEMQEMAIAKLAEIQRR